ncbi:MAG: hypothetical protein KY466_15235 [Gemmatimonadetes bacterium]|nr:hypothetical protein [Gemmatimonadota bacterium]
MRALLPALALLAALPLLLGCDADAPTAADAFAPGEATSSLTGSEWSEPVNVAEVNTEAAEQRPALSKNGLSLYFHSNREGGFGRNDLWVARRDCLDCPWQTPVNLGSVINTAGFNEAAPALSRDQHWLFFGSNRPGGQGAGDIWVTYRDRVHDDFAWGPPVNLGPGVNSAGGESQASYFENDGGRPQLFFSRGQNIFMSEVRPDGTWGTATQVQELAGFLGPSIHPNGLEIYMFELFKDHRIWYSRRESLDAPWSAPIELVDLTPGVASVFQPYIHAHGHTETLYVCGVPTKGGVGDIYVTTRRR